MGARVRLPLPPTAKQLHERFHVQFSLLKRLAGKAYYGQDNKGNKFCHAGQLGSACRLTVRL